MDELDREQLRARVGAFLGDAVEALGGVKQAHLVLKNRGLRTERGSPYSARAINSWTERHPKLPDADTLFAIAIASGVSLDRYAFEQAPADLAKRIGELEATQDWLLAWMMRDPEFVEAIRRRPQSEQASGA